jgi:hypothetical protein
MVTRMKFFGTIRSHALNYRQGITADKRLYTRNHKSRVN